MRLEALGVLGVKVAKGQGLSLFPTFLDNSNL
jgi:hypothetical protein